MDDVERIQTRIANKQGQIRKLQSSIDQDRQSLKRAQRKAKPSGERSDEDWFGRTFGF